MTNVDLSALRMEATRPTLPRGPRGPRLFALLLTLLAAGVALTFAWPLLRPVRVVPMVAVRAATTEGPTRTAVAEAAGWIEPDPFPVFVRPLVQGRLETIPLLEGATVRAGATVVATLSSPGLQAAQERAAALEAWREAELRAAEVAHAVVVAQLEQKAGLRLAVTEADMAVADVEQQLAAARGAHGRAAAEAEGAHAAVAAQERLATDGGAYAVSLARARAAATAADAGWKAALAQVSALEDELSAARARRALAEEVLGRPVVLEGAVAIAAAARGTARAAHSAARVECAIAERELRWAQVLAPADGVVLKLLAAPGAEVGPSGEAILSLYDPKRLRARIDVPLGSVSGITEGQAVELRSEVLGASVVGGVVQRIQQESDLLKNTLQVKVRIVDPPAMLRPETLCRARFLTTDSREDTKTSSLFLVPWTAVRDGSVFVFDPARARARAVAVDVLRQDGDTAVVRGELSVTHQVILAPVTDGETVRAEVR
jgi:RND family efflux transporter MFP subunit